MRLYADAGWILASSGHCRRSFRYSIIESTHDICTSKLAHHVVSVESAQKQPKRISTNVVIRRSKFRSNMLEGQGQIVYLDPFGISPYGHRTGKAIKNDGG